MKIKVSNLISDSGNNVANQFKIKTITLNDIDLDGVVRVKLKGELMS